MPRALTAQAGDVLDQLLWRETGSTAAIAAVLAANPGLAAVGATLAEGTVVLVPDDAAAAAVIVPLVNLWD
jgi:phage tail protein X